MTAEAIHHRALVDMDGVVFDFDGEIHKRMRARYPEIRPRQLDRPDFYTARNYPKEHQDTVWAICNEPGFIAELPLVTNALLGWQRLLDAGYIPQICSSLLPEEYAPHCKEEKLAALEEHFVPKFGAEVIKTALFTSQKHLVPGAVLIDDSPAPIKHGKEAAWEHVIFDRKCNQTPKSEGYLRLRGWRDPDLPEILTEATRRHLFKTKQL